MVGVGVRVREDHPPPLGDGGENLDVHQLVRVRVRVRVGVWFRVSGEG